MCVKTCGCRNNKSGTQCRVGLRLELVATLQDGPEQGCGMDRIYL